MSSIPSIADLLAQAWQEHTRGNLARAEAQYRAVLSLAPRHPNAWCFLGMVYADQGRHSDAEAAYRQAIALFATFPEAHNNLGNTLMELGKLDEAEVMLREAMRLRPSYAKAYNNLGNVHVKRGELEEAERCYRQAVAIEPNFAEAYNGLAAALVKQRRMDDAMVALDAVFAREPNHPEAHKTRSMCWLLRGDFARGWPEYEWRLKCKELAHQTWNVPPWNGSCLPGGTVLVHAEQGLGDTIQFVRYAPLVKARVGRVILECQPALERLMRTVDGIDQVVARGSALPPFNVPISLLSLPTVFSTTETTIPKSIPYLEPSSDLVAQWRQELAACPAFKVGIVWQGSPTHRDDRFRSVPLEQFIPFAKVPGVQLYSLQVGAETQKLRAGSTPVIDLGNRLHDFMDTAAVIKNLDLLLTVDTACAHLAGALGLPVWVAVPYFPDWRWLLDRPDSPWYPTMRLFRQTTRGAWGDVFAVMNVALDDVVENSKRKKM